jgi:hypothetical protein
MARPRKTSEELKKSGAKPFKVAKRVAEERIEAGLAPVVPDDKPKAKGLSLPAFIVQVAKERNTFFERLDPTKTVFQRSRPSAGAE